VHSKEFEKGTCSRTGHSEKEYSPIDVIESGS
jgi:hypothetical protein